MIPYSEIANYKFTVNVSFHLFSSYATIFNLLTRIFLQGFSINFLVQLSEKISLIQFPANETIF